MVIWLCSSVFSREQMFSFSDGDVVFSDKALLMCVILFISDWTINMELSFLCSNRLGLVVFK